LSSSRNPSPQGLKTAEHNVNQLQAERRSIEAKLAEAEAGYMADATDRRTKALMKISQLNQDITKARQKESYRRLMAPVDGTVQGLKIHTSGAVVTTAVCDLHARALPAAS